MVVLERLRRAKLGRNLLHSLSPSGESAAQFICSPEPRLPTGRRACRRGAALNPNAKFFLTLIFMIFMIFAARRGA